MKEYKIITGHPTNEIQKWLNQWRHEFKLEIIKMLLNSSNGEVTVLLTREKL